MRIRNTAIDPRENEPSALVTEDIPPNSIYFTYFLLLDFSSGASGMLFAVIFYIYIYKEKWKN
jgi:hypothetical protein